MAQDNISNLYNAIKDEYDVGSEEDFRLSVANADNRKNLYDAIKDDYDVGDEADFEASMGYGPNAVKAPEAEAPAATATQPTGQVVQPQAAQSEKSEQTPWRARALTAGGQPTTEGAMYDRMYKDLSRYYNDPNAQGGGSSAMRRLLDTNYDIKEDDPNSVFERNLIDAEGKSRVERSVGHGRRDALVNRVMDDFLRDEARAEADALVGRLPESGKADDMELELQENYYQTALQDRLQDEANRFGVPYGQYLERYVKPAIGEALRRDRNGLELPESALSGDPKTVSREMRGHDVSALNESEQALYDAVMGVFDERLAADEKAGRKASNEVEAHSPIMSPADYVSRPMISARAYNREADPQKAIASALDALWSMKSFGSEGGENGGEGGEIAEVDRSAVGQLLLKAMMQRLKDERKPQSTITYILSGLTDSDLGQILRYYTQTDFQRRLDELAMQEYEQGQHGISGLLATGGREALRFIGDAWEYYLGGKVGAKLTKAMQRKAEKALAEDLTMRGVKEDAAKRIATRVFARTPKSVQGKAVASSLHGSATLGVAGAVGGALTQSLTPAGGEAIEAINDRRAAGEEISKEQEEKEVAAANKEARSLTRVFAESVRSGASGSVMGGLFGLGTLAGEGVGRFSSRWFGDVASALSGYGARLVTNAAGATLLGEVEGRVGGVQGDVAKSFAGNLVNFLLLDAQSAAPRWISAHPVRNFRALKEREREVNFSDEDRQLLKECGYGELPDAIEKIVSDRDNIWRAQRSNDERKKEAARRKISAANEGMLDMLQDDRLPEELKKKLYEVVTGDMSRRLSPAVTAEVTRDEAGNYYLVNYNKDGDVISSRRYKSEKTAREAMREQGGSVDENLTSTLEDVAFGRDAWKLFENAALRAQAKPDGANASIIDLYNDRGRLQNALAAEMSGEALTQADRAIVERYRTVVNALRAGYFVPTQLARRVEIEAGVPEGSLHEAREGHTEKEARRLSEAQGGRAVDVGGGKWRTESEQALVDAYREALREHINHVERERIEAQGTNTETPKVPTAGPAQPSGGATGTPTPPDVEAEISAYYDARTHEDTGMLQPVVLKAQDADGKDRTVYVVQGRVATFDDGTIDVRASDPRLIVVNENGEREMMSPDKLLRAEEPTMAALAKRQAIAEAAQAAQGQQGSDPAAPVEGGALAQGEPAEPVGPTQTEPAQSEPAEQEPAEPVADEQEQPAEGAGESGEGAENAPMPMRDGEEDWAAVTPERAHAYLFGGEAGLSRSEGNAFVAAQIEAARKRLKKEQGQEPKMGTSIKKYKEEKAQHQGKMDEAQATLDYWQRVKSLQDEAAREEHDAAVAQAEAERAARKKAEAERKAVGNENPMPAITEKWNGAAKIDGNRDELVLPNGERVKGRYVLHESGASSPSHNPVGWQKTEGFPMDTNGGTVNDRDYEKDRDAQQMTEQMAANYDQRALQTPVVVSRDGVVLSGNGRTMAGELAARSNTDGAYVDYLKEHAAKYGFTREQVESMEHPRVSFVPDEQMPYTAETFAKFNRQEMKSQNRTEQAVKLGKTVSDDTFAGIVRTISGYDTLGAFYADAEASIGALRALRADGVLGAAEWPEMTDGPRGNEQLSERGRAVLENVLIGKAFAGNGDAVRMLTEVPSMRQRVVTALGALAENLAMDEEWTLRQQLADAVKLCYDARMDGYGLGERVSGYARQGELFADPEGLQTVADVNDAAALILADALNDKRVNRLKDVLGLYNREASASASGQTDMFAGGVRTRVEILRDVINYLTNEKGRKGNEAGSVQAGVATKGSKGSGRSGREKAGASSKGVSQASDAGVRQSEQAGGLSERVDSQGNPLNDDGTLKIEKIGAIDELTDGDFEKPTRTVQLPELPANVDAAIGANGKPVIIKKNIFEKNAAAHEDVTAAEGRTILERTLYNPAIIGQAQPITRPHYWVAIETKDGKSVTVIEVNSNKDNIEVVGWHKLDKKGLEKLKKQAEREDGQLLIQTSDEAAAALSTLPQSTVSTGKGRKKTATERTAEGEKQSVLQGFYKAEPVQSDFSADSGYMRNAEKKAVKDVNGLFKALVKALGIADPTVVDAKGKKQKNVTANIAPVGGDIVMRIPLGAGYELNMRFGFEPAGDVDAARDRGDASPDSLVLNAIRYRVEDTGKSGQDKYVTRYYEIPVSTNLENMLGAIRKVAGNWLPRQERAGGKMTAEEAAAAFPFTRGNGQRYKASAIKTDEQGERYVVQYEGETLINGTSLERKLTVKNAPEEATMVVFSPNGVVPMGYAAWDEATGEYKVWDMDGKPVQIVREERAGNEERKRVANVHDGIEAIRSIAAGADFVPNAMQREDLAQYGGSTGISFYWGETGNPAKAYKGGYGLSHIGAKHGTETLLHIVDVIANGKVDRFVEGNKTVVLSNGGYECVLALTKNGDKETWLLSGWKKKEKADGTGEVSAQSEPTQESPTFSRAQLGAAFSDAKIDNFLRGKRNGLDEIREMRAYHGSGADFERFDTMQHLGEGEGSQAFGAGTYVADQRELGARYANIAARSDEAILYNGHYVTEKDSDGVKSVAWALQRCLSKKNEGKATLDMPTVEELIGYCNSAMDYYLHDYIPRNPEYRDYGMDKYKECKTALEYLKEHGMEGFTAEPTRVLYTVEIPDDTGKNYLDWDGRWEGNEEVAGKLYDEIFKNDTDGAYDTPSAKEALRKEVDGYLNTHRLYTNGDVYGTISSFLGSDKAASEFLNGLGYAGMKVRAAHNSGDARYQKNWNYVIFNDNDVKITDRVRFFRTRDGMAYGFTVGGRIYLDPKIATSEAAAPLTEAEVALRDAVAERMRQAGIETSLDDEEGQRVLDLAERAGEPVREMGNHHSKEAEERNRWRRAYDVANAFVTGRTPSQVKADRQEAERQWKKKTQNLFDAVLRGEWNDATLQLIEEYISDVTPDNPYYHPLSRRLPSRVLRTLPKGERTGSVDALFSRISESAVPAAGKTVAERRRAVQAKKEELLRGWADATGHWHTDVRDFTDDTTPIGSGKDSEVYRSRDGQHVIKVSKGKNEGRRFISDPDSVALFNSVFRDTPYKILGYGEIDGKFVTFLEQPTVDFAENAPVSVPERVEYMAKRGFKPVNKAQTAFSNGTLFVADVQKGNIVKDKAGNIRVIDADVKLHTKDIGGEYTYPPVETDLPGSANRNGGVREMRAYHGSGARFDEFDSSHMGEGEGAQAHGHGHYVAVKEGTARGYGYDAQRTKNAGATVFLLNGEALNGDDAVDAIFESTEGLGENRYGNANRARVQNLLNRLANGETKKDVADGLYRDEQDARYQQDERRADVSRVLRTEVLPNLEINEEETASRYLYSVEIPENKGGNYIEEGKEYSPRGKDVKRIKQALYNHLIEHDEGGSYEDEASRKSLKKEIDGDFGAGLTGRELYRNVAARLGSDEAASAFLHDLGYKGIHYYGRQDGECYVVFDDGDLTITDRVRFFRGTGGEVLGFTVGGRVYLDPRRATAETPLHEYTHLWAGMLRSVNPKEWANVVELMKGEQALWAEVQGRYPELAGDDDALAEEVLAHYSGRRGAERLRQEQARIATGTGSVGAKARAIAALERLKAVLGRFWRSVGDLLGLHFERAEEVADQVLGDLARGVNPTSLTQPHPLTPSPVSPTPDPSPVGRGESGRGGRIAYSLGDGRGTFEARQRKAVQDKGTVMQGLNGAEVRVVDVPRHDYAGSIADATKQAVDAAKKKYAPNGKPIEQHYDNYGQQFDYTISGNAIDESLNPKQQAKSDNKGVHLAVVEHLDKVIGESIEVEEHPDYMKNGHGERTGENINENAIMHRFYGAVSVDGVPYRVMTLMREDRNSGNGVHAYEVTKVEVLNEKSPSTPSGTGSPSTVGVAKLLQNVEKSYDKGKKLLDESAKADEDNMLYRSEETEQAAGADGRAAMHAAAEELATELGETVEVVDDVESIAGGNATQRQRRRKAKGWYDPATGRVVVVAANHTSAADVRATVLHEVVGHKGLRALLGEGFDAFLDRAYNGVGSEARAVIDAEAAQMARRRPNRTEERCRRAATEEYVARLAEQGFEDRKRQSIWRRIVQAAKDLLSAIRLRFGVRVSDADLRYMLWRSHELASGRSRTALGALRDARMRAATEREELERRDGREGDDIEAVNELFNDRLDELVADPTQKDRVLHLGRAGSILRAGGLSDAEIILDFDRLSKKASEIYKNEHPFDFADIKNLPKAINSPIAIFSQENGKVVLTELQKDGRNFIVAVRAVEQQHKDGKVLEVNEITSLYPKKERGIINWINTGKTTFIDKEKARNFIEALQPHAGTTIKEAELSTAAKVVENFENPAMVVEENSDDLLYRSGDESGDGVARAMYNERVEAEHEIWREAWQDDMLPVRRMQEAVMAEAGGELKDSENAYIQENNGHGVMRAESEQYELKYYRPLLKAVRDVAQAAGMELRDVERYMMAKHGLERNEKFAERDAEAAFEAYKAEHPNGEKTQADFMEEYRGRDYSGLTGMFGKGNVAEAEEAARALVADVEGRTYTEALWAATNVEALWAATNAATKRTLRQSYEDGIISKDTYEKVRDMFSWYVPLRGFENATAEDLYDYVSGGGTAFSPTLHRAKGRGTEAESPLAYIASMAESAIVQGRKNRTKQAFLQMALNHPTNLLTVSEMWYTNHGTAEAPEWREDVPEIPENATADEVAAIVKEHEAAMERLAEEGRATKKRGRLRMGVPIERRHVSEHHVEVLVNGKKYVIYVNGSPRAAQALNGTRKQRASEHSFESSRLAELNRRLAQAYTSLSPKFVVRNLIRDYTMATAMTFIKEGPQYALRFQGNVAKLGGPMRMFQLMYLYRNDKLDMSKETQRLFYEFMTQGGETGFTTLKELHDYEKDMQRAYQSTTRHAADPREGVKAVMRGVELANRCIEDMSRFATYMASRQSGKSVAQSVQDAKNITLNFNRKGSGERGNATFRNLYIFVNPAIQAMHQVASAMRHHPGRTGLALGIISMAGMAAPLLVHLLAQVFKPDDGYDPEEAYRQLPAWQRQSNYVLWIPGTHKFLMIPLGQEFRAAHGLGEATAAWLTGRGGKEAYLDVAGMVADLLPVNPEGNGWNPLINFLPTMAQPVAQVMFNTDFTGRPIWRETEWNKYDPAYQKAYVGTPAELVAMSAGINELTGGNAHKQGKLERYAFGQYLNNPAVADHLLSGYLGGLYSFSADLVGSLWRAGQGELPDARELPIVNALVTAPRETEQSGSPKMDDRYYELKEENDRTAHELSGWRGDAERGDTAAAKRYKDFLRSEAGRAYLRERAYMQAISRLRGAAKRTSDAERRERLLHRIDSLQQIVIGQNQ